MKRCEMERISQMKEFIEAKKNVLIKERINKMKYLFIENIDNKKSELQNILKELSKNKNEGKLVISYLRSSYILSSHEFYVAFYEEEAFVEEEPPCIYFDLNPIFDGVDVDLRKLDQALHENFIRIFAEEKEEIHRWYMEQIYMQFVHIVGAMTEGITEEGETEIYYGGYMDALEFVSKI